MLQIPLVNKEASLGLLQHRLGQGKNFKQIEEEKEDRDREKPCNCQRRQIPELCLVSHSHMTIHRIIEMG